MFDPNKFAAIQIGLASPEEIESWAQKDENGKPLQVTKAETVNYRTQKPEEDGLFCEKIFGPSKDYECKCGKYKKKAYAGTICEKCHVEITTKAVRRERMSFIDLAAPVTHIWYLKGTPSRIALVLGISPKDLEEVAYFISHITISKGVSPFVGKDKVAVEFFKDREVLDEQSAKEKFRIVLDKLLDPQYNLIVEGSDDYLLAQSLIESLDEPYLDFSSISKFIAKYYKGLEFGYGAEAIQRILASIDLDKEKESIKAEYETIKDSKNDQLISSLTKRLETIEAFIKSNNRPEWMILTKLPVIPPDLRPMLPLDGSRFASADLNELYRRVIQRNISLQNFIRVDAPEVMLINAKRMLQESVDALIENGKRTKAVSSTNNRPFKSLSAVLKGKQGRFRQNLLGKRVDYSGRSVIAVGPTLKMDECGLPREMAVQLFRPFIAHKLVEGGFASNAKIADSMIEANDKNIWGCLDEVIKEHPVLLNRAPTLHRLGIQAFHPKLVEGRAIRLFPLATTAFNADFDGDQMAVHVPLSNEAIWEAENLMLGSKNILGPKDGKPIVTPTKDMVLGNYFLTMEEDENDFRTKIEEAKKWNDTDKIAKYELFILTEGKAFANKEEAIIAYQTKQIHLHSRIAVKGKGMHNSTFTEEQNNSYLITTVGKIIFNEIFDEGFPFLNNPKTDKYKDTTPDEYFLKPGVNIKETIKSLPKKAPFDKKQLGNIINEFLKHFGVDKTSEMLNKMKDQGFKFATDAAVTVSLFDIIALDNKNELIEEGQKEVDKYEEAYEEGLLTASEKHRHIVDLWQAKTSEIGDKVYSEFMKQTRNPFVMMSASGAGGNKSNFNQLAGMRGNMNKPNGDVIELPIKSSLRDGLTVSEFFNSTHGTRKGGADTALKTAKSGYLTRRLVDVGQDIIIREEDCGCVKGLVVKEIIDASDGTIIEPLLPRISGRFAMKDVVDPSSGEVYVKGGELISETIAEKIVKAGIKEVEIRSVFTCQSKNGVCQKCYGTNLATSKVVALGEAVGVMAAQSIGEPGTQLTMRNFNTGGVSGGSDITRGLPRVEELFEARKPVGEALIAFKAGTIRKIEEKDGTLTIYVLSSDKEEPYTSSFGAKLAKHLDENGELTEPIRPLKAGDKVMAGQKLTEGPIDPKSLLNYTDALTVQKYILKEVQKVYRPVQAIDISDKHIEIMVKQMFKDMKITHAGKSGLTVGKVVPISVYNDALVEAFKNNETDLPAGLPTVLGITKSSINVDSFLSAASFQETTRVLTDAVVKGKVDKLHGLKENVIVGKLIPAGTGLLDKRFATPKDKEEK